MTTQEFGEGLNYLKCFYANWNLDISNHMVISIWYENFKNIEFRSFQEIVKLYCSNNRFPPQSPFDLIDIIPKELNVYEAWELIYDCIRRSSNNSIFLNMVLKQYPKLYPFVSSFDIDNVEKDSFGNKTIGYSLGRRFKREYKEYLDRINIKIINDRLISNSNNNLLIENIGGKL